MIKHIQWNKQVFKIGINRKCFIPSVDFNLFTIQLQPQIRNFCYKYRSILNVEHNELMQIANECMLEMLMKFDPKRACWSTYFIGQLYNRVIDKLRKDNRRRLSKRINITLECDYLKED